MEKSTPAIGDAAEHEDRQVVVLRLAGEMYGIDIAQVDTVINMQTITAVPKSQPYVKGVINLRGRVIPVIDLRLRFDLPALAGDREGDSRIVIIETAGLSAGLVVDGVSEVMRIPSQRIDPPSQLVKTAESDCVVGIARIAATAERSDASSRSNAFATSEERLIILIDVTRILCQSTDENRLSTTLQKAA